MVGLRTYRVAEGEMGSFVSAWNDVAVTGFNRHGIRVAGGWTSPGSGTCAVPAVALSATALVTLKRPLADTAVVDGSKSAVSA